MVPFTLKVDCHFIDSESLICMSPSVSNSHSLGSKVGSWEQNQRSQEALEGMTETEVRNPRTRTVQGSRDSQRRETRGQTPGPVKPHPQPIGPLLV